MIGKLTPRRIVHAIQWRCRHFVDHFMYPVLAQVFMQLRFFFRLPQKPHGLPGELIVSLTSFPPRYKTLAPTIKCLLTQSVKPDQVILWVYGPDMAQLPAQVTALVKDGLLIKTCEHDVGPYKKLIPALAAFPDAFHVTADDDLFYARDWLQTLVQNWSGDRRQIVCLRAHAITRYDDGSFRPYTSWDMEIAGPVLSTGIFPTSGHGILFPPGSLAPEVLDQSQFLKLAPKADDVWWYFMALRAGSIFKKTPGRMRFVNWVGSQEVALYHENVTVHGNDIKIAAVAAVYGADGQHHIREAS